ncbi:hypothetical protein EET67_07280 [Pseudaminobacter arsenicus]|uniref:Uncharacterized protein n=1 Tax=Borborobacter arsenicus TaxID=1851146 RepID=A0A432V8E9_9HYPH|nr:hypothetical protein [Pseudaminobacter arsenicus]RUM98429.1 hypothetical protein EET67_07280 [Pseudaminobacter arsenicus]
MRLGKLETWLLPALAAGFAIGLAAPATAGGDRVYADSFGNLVINSGAGYKRIIVGQGQQARELSRYMRDHDPRVVYLDEAEKTAGCFRPPVLVKGRSYMYGFDQGVIPLRGGPCR